MPETPWSSHLPPVSSHPTLCMPSLPSSSWLYCGLLNHSVSIHMVSQSSHGLLNLSPSLTPPMPLGGGWGRSAVLALHQICTHRSPSWEKTREGLQSGWPKKELGLKMIHSFWSMEIGSMDIL